MDIWPIFGPLSNSHHSPFLAIGQNQTPFENHGSMQAEPQDQTPPHDSQSPETSADMRHEVAYKLTSRGKKMCLGPCKAKFTSERALRSHTTGILSFIFIYLSRPIF